MNERLSLGTQHEDCAPCLPSQLVGACVSGNPLMQFEGKAVDLVRCRGSSPTFGTETYEIESYYFINYNFIRENLNHFNIYVFTPSVSLMFCSF